MVTEATEPRPADCGSHLTRVDFAAASRKRDLRRRSRAQRASLSAEQRWEHDLARFRHLSSLIPRGTTIACYLSRDGEPATGGIIAVLWRRGHRILAPVLTLAGRDRLREPSWAWYGGPNRLREGLGGIPEPVGEALPPAALEEADIIIVSSLAAGRDGSRMGGGAGWFDRALMHARCDAQVWALANECELLDTVPTQDHDLPVHLVITESGVTRTG